MVEALILGSAILGAIALAAFIEALYFLLKGDDQ